MAQKLRPDCRERGREKNTQKLSSSLRRIAAPRPPPGSEAVTRHPRETRSPERRQGRGEGGERAAERRRGKGEGKENPCQGGGARRWCPPPVPPCRLSEESEPGQNTPRPTHTKPGGPRWRWRRAPAAASEPGARRGAGRGGASGRGPGRGRGQGRGTSAARAAAAGTMPRKVS